jgi:hypothetical protein
MTIEQLREKIAYRTNKMNWCISVGRETQAEWNRDQIARLEESIRVMEQDAAMEDCVVHPVSIWQLRTEIALANASNRPASNRPASNRPASNRPARNTDEDFDYV